MFSRCAHPQLVSFQLLPVHPSERVLATRRPIPPAGVADEAGIMEQLRAAVVAWGGGAANFSGWLPGSGIGWLRGAALPHCSWSGVECDEEGRVEVL
jgi:hypothetical protein